MIDDGEWSDYSSRVSGSYSIVVEVRCSFHVLPVCPQWLIGLSSRGPKPFGSVYSSKIDIDEAVRKAMSSVIFSENA